MNLLFFEQSELVIGGQYVIIFRECMSNCKCYILHRLYWIWYHIEKKDRSLHDPLLLDIEKSTNGISFLFVLYHFFQKIPNSQGKNEIKKEEKDTKKNQRKCLFLCQVRVCVVIVTLNMFQCTSPLSNCFNRSNFSIPCCHRKN